MKEVNQKFVDQFWKEYFSKLDDVTKKYIEQCMTIHGYELPKKGINEHTLRSFCKKIAKEERPKKLMVVIVTNKDLRLPNGDTIVKKHLYVEIVKFGVHLGTFKHMILRRFPKAVSVKDSWEGCDYAKLYGIKRRGKDETV